LNLSWDTVREIQKKYLYRHYNNPDIKGVRYIGIDEFALAKGHIYKTIVVDLETGRIIYIGDGKGSDALDGFRKKVKKTGIKIEAVATDLSAAFVSSVTTNASGSTLVFDHFHVVKLMNEALDEIKRSLYREEKDLNKRKVMKGIRWLLLRSGKDIYDQKFFELKILALHDKNYAFVG
jgi:transposase